MSEKDLFRCSTLVAQAGIKLRNPIISATNATQQIRYAVQGHPTGILASYPNIYLCPRAEC